MLADKLFFPGNLLYLLITADEKKKNFLQQYTVSAKQPLLILSGADCLATNEIR